MARARAARAERRRQVEALAAAGLPPPAIAWKLGISSTVLRRYYRAELRRGMAQAVAAVRERLVKAAVVYQDPATAVALSQLEAGRLTPLPDPQAAAAGPYDEPLRLDLAALIASVGAELLEHLDAAGMAAVATIVLGREVTADQVAALLGE
jgi:hypothetical protein